MGHSIAPMPPARYPSIPNKQVILFRTLMSEIVPDTIICSSAVAPARPRSDDPARNSQRRLLRKVYSGPPLVSRTPMKGDNPSNEVFDGKASTIHSGV
jgi:hypothetical protein